MDTGLVCKQNSEYIFDNENLYFILILKEKMTRF